MAWVDDRIWCHPKFTGLSPAAGWVWTKGCAFSAGMGTGGVLTREQQKLVGAKPKVRQELVAAGLWDDRGETIYVHDWDEHNGKRDARRVADRERKRALRSTGTSAGQSVGTSSGSAAGTAHVDFDGSELKPKAVAFDLDVAARTTERPGIAHTIEQSLRGAA